MAQVVRLHQYGGPEALVLEDVDPVAPAPDEVQVRNTAIGLNYIDVYDRTGLYALPLPGVLGREAAGVVAAVGRRARGFRVGDRVAYVHPGAYCQVHNVPARHVVKVPAGISDREAAALMLKGLTAQYLLRRTYRVQRGDAILVHAAAGGVGLILTQWARARGAR
ncbi:MAG: alcohol dehydrogenase catalytic domain-containing protein, partial [Steroidobacteraceae bacterium]